MSRILIGLLVLAVSAPVGAQSLQRTTSPAVAPVAPVARLNLTVPPELLIPQQGAGMPVSAAMHPAAKGALIGGAVGAGFWGAIAIWYCTIGPSEAGECENSGQWLKGVAAYGGAGAALGALIGAIAGR